MAIHYIRQFEIGDVVFLKRKFITYKNYYIVSATSIKVTTLDFDSMPATRMNIVVTGFTTQIVKNIEGNIILEFYVEEKIGTTTTRRSQNLQAALEANPIPITTEQTNQKINNSQVDQNSQRIACVYCEKLLYPEKAL
ncbi:64_t:CDS:2 [Scutellospora calospora]|uniref:64_t:CDS:1 n=1 Tax=Scutellospora calospora TaxID=85575 RepID=A0ACA9KIF6_9GLOM|nr:64_t:CDS:2 [Scutellospora calospora]